MTLTQAFIERARELGFARVHIGEASAYEHWRADTTARPNRRWASLTHDPQAVLKGATRVAVLAWPYKPHREQADKPALDAYYLACNTSYHAARPLAKWLIERGARAVADPPLPHKAAAVASGLARYGRNGLSYIDELGSRYALELIVTDAPLEIDEAVCEALPCEACGACVRACPTGALMGDGRVDVALCLRAMMLGDAVPEQYRALIGNRVIGCDICQRVCPKNARVGFKDMPDDVQRAIDLEKLLTGDTDGLADMLGYNYARKKRLQSMACLVAANTGRVDLLPLIASLTNDEHEPLRTHAAWAVTKLTRA